MWHNRPTCYTSIIQREHSGNINVEDENFIQEIKSALTNDNNDTATDKIKVIIKQFRQHSHEVHQDTIKN